LQRLLFNARMKWGLSLLVVVLLPLTEVWGQAGTPAAPSSDTSAAAQPSPTAAKRSLFGRMLHPFSSDPSSSAAAKYKDARLRGLTLELQVSPQPVKLSEVRQLDIKATLTNHGKNTIELDFPTDQRIEIYLRNAADTVLTKWSENHAVVEKPAVVLVNPGEHIEYNEKIATRELARDKVYLAEVFFPQYPELRIRQKFMTAP
jgi:hypothetical protein